MNYVILDLEWNTSFSNKRKKYVNEIIEFGAVKTDENMEIIDTFSMLITPQIGKKLRSHIAKLTHITNEELFLANNTFSHVVKCFEKFLGKGVLLTWSTSDILTLIENYNYYYHMEKLPFLTKYCNLQTYCEKSLGVYNRSTQLGLSACAQMLEISDDTFSLHRACDDAELSFHCLKKLFDEEKLRQMTELASTNEFYKKITFKTRFLTDLNNPHVDKTQMFFDCPVCNEKMKQKTDWMLKGKSFTSDFWCKSCKEEYLGRISFKLRYEETVVKKKLVSKKELKKEQERIKAEKEKGLAKKQERAKEKALKKQKSELASETNQHNFNINKDNLKENIKK